VDFYAANNAKTPIIRYEVLQKELRHAGWMVLISGHVRNAKEALRIYRAKDVVEKGFPKDASGNQGQARLRRVCARLEAQKRSNT
jgi:hypothetical protein